MNKETNQLDKDKISELKRLEKMTHIEFIVEYVGFDNMKAIIAKAKELALEGNAQCIRFFLDRVPHNKRSSLKNRPVKDIVESADIEGKLAAIIKEHGVNNGD